MSSPLIFLLGAVFLLFPLAHRRLIEAWPLYLAELPLLLAALLFLSLPAATTVIKKLSIREKWAAGAALLFLMGALLPFLFGLVSGAALGRLKSFVILPIIFMVLLACAARREASQAEMLFLWWLGILASALAGNWLLFEGILTYDHRLASLYLSPNHFAMLLSPGVLIGLYFSLRSAGRERLLFLGGTLLIFVPLLATRSAGAIGATLLSSLVFFFCCPKRGRQWRLGALITLAMVAGSIFFLEGPRSVFQSLVDFEGRTSLASRFMIWEAASKISVDHFPLGIGLGRFQEAYLAYQPLFPPYLEWAVPEPHNLWLALHLSTGLAGVSAFAFLVTHVLSRLIASLRKKPSPAGALHVSLITWFLLVGLVDTPYFKNDLAFLLWGILGLSLAFLERERRSATN